MNKTRQKNLLYLSALAFMLSFYCTPFAQAQQNNDAPDKREAGKEVTIIKSEESPEGESSFRGQENRAEKSKW